MRKTCLVLPKRFPAWAALLLAVSASVCAGADSPRAVFPQTGFEFGKVLSGVALEHDFVLKNEGDVALRVLRVQLTSPLIVTRMPALVAPGSQARIQVRLDTSGLRGRFPGEIQVFLDDPALPEANLRFEGEIVPPVEFLPAPVFFLGARRGESREASIEVINHQPEPLRIEEVRHPTDRFTTRLETLEEGRRYRLTLRLKSDGPGGRHSEPIVLKTSSLSQPAITVVANTILRERVYTFPDQVDFGTLRLGDLKQTPGLVRTTAQTLMVYQFGGTDFKVTVQTDVPQLEVRSERGPRGDRYQNTLTLVPEKLKAGVIRGSVFIQTNDPEFPSLVVPITGNVLP